MATEAMASRAHRHIYVYNNIRTNQVVYSLNRVMNDTDILKQLPFAGKKTKPAFLRKDIWSPFLTIEFPIPQQCHYAYQKLREYRRLHELHWDREYKPGEKLPNRQERAKLIMDQKANSVADLADILIKQEEQAFKLMEEKRAEDEASAQKAQEQQAVDAAELDRLENGGIQAYYTHIKDFSKQIELAKTEKKKDSLTRKIDQLRQELNEMRWILETNRPGTLARIGADPLTPDEAEMLTNARALPLGIDKRYIIPTGSDGAFREEITTLTPSEKQPITGRIIEEKNAEGAVTARQVVIHGTLARRGTRRRRLMLGKTIVVPTMQGVKISWADMSDAEFAAAWPARVVHQMMGFARHTAPDPTKEPVLRLADRDEEMERELEEHVQLDGEANEEGPETEEEKGEQGGEEKKEDVEGGDEGKTQQSKGSIFSRLRGFGRKKETFIMDQQDSTSGSNQGPRV